MNFISYPYPGIIQLYIKKHLLAIETEKHIHCPTFTSNESFGNYKYLYIIAVLRLGVFYSLIISFTDKQIRQLVSNYVLNQFLLTCN